MTSPTVKRGWMPVIPARYAKAIAAVIGAGIGAYLTARTDGVVTGDEWAWIVGVAIGASGVVAVTPNKP